MALIIETGAGIPGANSYVSLSDAQAFVSARGLTTVLTEGLLLQAMDALRSVCWNGQKVNIDNPLDWPRYAITDRDGYHVPQDTIPAGIVQGQIWAAFYIAEGEDPAARTGLPIRTETVGPISTTFAVRAGEKDTISLFSLPNVRHALSDYWDMGGRIDRA